VLALFSCKWVDHHFENIVVAFIELVAHEDCFMIIVVDLECWDIKYFVERSIFFLLCEVPMVKGPLLVFVDGEAANIVHDDP